MGRPRRLVPDMARFITIRVTLSASRLWTCPNQRRRPQRITSSIGETCRMLRISSFRMWSCLNTPRIPQSILISVVAIFLNLAHFLSEELCLQAPVDKEIVVAGGLRDELEVKSSTGAATELGSLMKSGTSKERLHIPTDAVLNKLIRGSAASLLTCNALTVCHTTCYIANHARRSSWKIFKDYHGFLKNLGIGDLTEETLKSPETFVCRIYNVYRTDSIDAARLLLFSETGSQKQSPNK